MSRKSVAPKTLDEKLFVLQHAVPVLEADGNNGDFDFVKASTIMTVLREQFHKYRLRFKATEKEAKDQVVDTASGPVLHSSVTTLFTVRDLDTKESEEWTFSGSAWSSDNTAPYKAKTGALKYFLREIGLVPFLYLDAEESDAGLPRQSHRKTKQERQAETQLRAFDSACAKSGLTYTQARDYLVTKFGKAMAAELSKKEFDEAMQYATAQMPLADSLTASLEAATKKKANGSAQPIVSIVEANRSDEVATGD